MAELPQQVLATDLAIHLTRTLRDKHGPLMFHQSGGCCDGSSPMCYPRGELLVGDSDVQLGAVDGEPFYGSMAVFVGREAGARLRSVEESKGRSFPNSPEGPVRGATVRAKYGGRCAAAFCLSFSRHEEIYRSDVDGAWKSCKGVGICASPTAAATSPDFDFSVRKK
jgi:uncharacterized protein (DUF779 family)